MSESVSLSAPSTVTTNSFTDVSASVTTDIKDFGTLTAEVEFFAGGSSIGTDSPHESFAGGTINQGTSFTSDTTWSPRGAERNVTVSVSVTLNYSNSTTVTLEDSTTVNILEQETQEQAEAEQVGNSPANTLSEFYSNRTPFSIDSISYDGSTPASLLARENSDAISFNYKNPSISVDSSARFVKHELVGSQTVRQKIGQDPIEITINGVCFRDTARRIDGLRYANTGILRSDRFDDASITVQFESSSTDPLEDGSAVSLTEANELFSFTINCTEVL